MGKAKRATRKELEDVIAGIIQELTLVRNELKALGNYFAMYVEYKGDNIHFNGWMNKRIKEMQNELQSNEQNNESNLEGSTANQR